jgi:ferredoxin-NADP reductase
MPGNFLRLIAEHPAPVAGLLIVGGLLLEVLFLTAGGLQRLFAHRRRDALARQRLELQIERARLEIKVAEDAKLAWNGIRKFSVAKKVEECADTFSFYLEPHDRRPLPPYKPGQYLTFQLNLPGRAKPVVRCYSLSDCARRNQYRVTIKRCPAPTEGGHPPGVGSTYFCDQVKVGDILDAKAPSGHFHLDVEKDRPVVLISGGVGVTPMIAMANAIVEARTNREAWFFHGARSGADHMFRDHVRGIADENKNLRVHNCYSRPGPGDVAGQHYQHEGRVTVDLLKEVLPSNNFDYYLCGPGAFMEAITEDLRRWGVPDEWVHYEAFGPASVKRAAKPEAKVGVTFAPMGGIDVTFARAGRTLAWQGGGRSLLELAEEARIKIDAGCRAGNCGSCLVAIKSGTVEYLTAQPADVEAGSCLACICRPATTLVIDA